MTSSVLYLPVSHETYELCIFNTNDAKREADTKKDDRQIDILICLYMSTSTQAFLQGIRALAFSCFVYKRGTLVFCCDAGDATHTGINIMIDLRDVLYQRSISLYTGHQLHVVTSTEGRANQGAP